MIIPLEGVWWRNIHLFTHKVVMWRKENLKISHFSLPSSHTERSSQINVKKLLTSIIDNSARQSHFPSLSQQWTPLDEISYEFILFIAAQAHKIIHTSHIWYLFRKYIKESVFTFPTMFFFQILVRESEIWRRHSFRLF